PVFSNGDGTVPLWSLESSTATAMYYVPYQSGFVTDESTAHGDLPANKTVQEIADQIVDHENGSGAPLPDSGQYPRPAEWMGQTLTPGKELETRSDFELHSDAHLHISSSNGKILGLNQNGMLEESLPGTFLSMDGIEYASIEDISASLKVRI